MEESVTISVSLYDSLKISEQLASKIRTDQQYFGVESHSFGGKHSYIFFITKDEAVRELHTKIEALEKEITELKMKPRTASQKKPLWKRL